MQNTAIYLERSWDSLQYNYTFSNVDFQFHISVRDIWISDTLDMANFYMTGREYRRE